MRVSTVLALAAATAACNIDFGADVPCTADGDCPREQVCDLYFLRCVDGAVEGSEDVEPEDVSDDDAEGGDLVDDGSGAEDVAADVSDAADGSGAGDVVSDGSGGDVGGADGSGTEVGPDACTATGPEVCDEVDNDCDGTVDNPPACDGVGPCGAGMTLVELDASTAYCIDLYEASRNDATAASPGSTATATSRAGVLPWSTLSLDAAMTACGDVGKRLCTPAEWQFACQGASASQYPYGNSYVGDRCNGANVPPNDAAAPTGSFTGCVSVSGVFDMSGNLQEWTTDGILRGGAFAEPQLNMRCSARATPASPSDGLPTYGFRCCKDSP